MRARRAGIASNGAARELGRGRVVEIQRARILAAMVDVAAERGVANVTVAHIVSRSGVSRRTFYELFADREECSLAAFEDAVAAMAAVVVPAFERPGSWSEKVWDALVALLGLLEGERALARFAVVETLGAGGSALELRRRVLASLIAAVDRGRGEGRSGQDPPPLAAEGVVGGVLAVLHARLCDRAQAPLIELAGPLASMIVLPYTGVAAARRQSRRPVPERGVLPSQPRAGSTDPLRDLDMRLTYRTVRVLIAVAELAAGGSHPSNREVGVASGMHDQGQISKLLSRLHRLGLIENTATAPSRGASNAWMLTPKGAEIEAAVVRRAD